MNDPAVVRAIHDRILAAQSELESMVLVTVDPAFVEFQSKTLW